jgi:hypothetical protein
MRQILNWFRRGKLESGFERELQYHIDRRAADLVRSGLPERVARRRAMSNSAASRRSRRKCATFG